MDWRFTEDVAEYADAAGPLLAADPVRHTVSLTVIENARVRAHALDEPELFGWWTGQDGTIAGAVSHTPPFGLLLGVVPDEAVQPLAEALWRSVGDPRTDRRLSGVNGPAALAAQFAAVWTRRTGERAVLRDAQRLHRLEELVPPEPAPPGRARPATAEDTELLIRWLPAFHGEVGGVGTDPEVTVADRLSYGGFVLWEDEHGEPVSLAGRTRTAAGVARVAPVYTPPERRRRGWAAGATVAVTRAALEQGAREVVLFTQLDNPTSNALYHRLGYRPVADRLVFAFEPA
ncbi:MAG: GNAT family N-acetyltransferase [Streptosporangiales bacterium]|nr:GNAT family N-acetyltransferase [Streptosporangiales bacterium]